MYLPCLGGVWPDGLPVDRPVALWRATVYVCWCAIVHDGFWVLDVGECWCYPRCVGSFVFEFVWFLAVG